MSNVDDYRQELKIMDTWDDFLRQESRLPGPRANLELAFAVALEADEERILRYAGLGAGAAPANTPEEFLALCGVVGLGYLAARGGGKHFSILRAKASDARWRIREAVALGLQKYGQTSFENLLEVMGAWSQGTLLERRAVVATMCEPILLTGRDDAVRILDILDTITASLLDETDRRAEAFRILRQALGYGWSVAVAAQPEVGKPRMEKWIGSQDGDIRWIMKKNLEKKRLSRMDASWVKSQLEALG